MELKLAAEEIETLIQRGFNARAPFLKIEQLEPGRVRTRLLYRESWLRPGRVLSGPALFAAADVAMYALVLSHTGADALMAVTSQLDINFLAKGEPGDIVAEASMLKLGRRTAVMEVRLASAARPDVQVAHAVGSYALPRSGTPKDPLPSA